MSDLKALLLKATPELLDGWCGPAMFVAEGDKLANAIPCVYLGPGEHGGDLVFVPRHGVRELRRGLLYLDLARAECRDRVRRKLNDDGSDSAPAFSVYRGVGGVWFGGWHEPDVAAVWGGPSRGAIIALSALDPNDDTRLSDGSRLVDALALHAVATEVLHG